MEKVNTLCKQLDSLYRRYTKTNFDYTLQMALGNIGMAQHLQMQLDAIEAHIAQVQKELREAFDEVEK